MTPGTTPFGTRDIRVFFCFGSSVGSDCMWTAAALEIAVLPGGAGGGVVSSVLITEAGRASSERR